MTTYWYCVIRVTASRTASRDCSRRRLAHGVTTRRYCSALLLLCPDSRSQLLSRHFVMRGVRALTTRRRQPTYGVRMGIPCFANTCNPDSLMIAVGKPFPDSASVGTHIAGRLPTAG